MQKGMMNKRRKKKYRTLEVKFQMIRKTSAEMFLGDYQHF
jgi:hypothetical protein